MLPIRQVSCLMPFLVFLTALKIKPNFLSLACKAILDMVLAPSDHIYHSPPRSLCLRPTSSSWALSYAKRIPASGPLHMLFPPPGRIIPPDPCRPHSLTIPPSLLKCHPLTETFLSIDFPLTFLTFLSQHSEFSETMHLFACLSLSPACEHRLGHLVYC